MLVACHARKKNWSAKGGMYREGEICNADEYEDQIERKRARGSPVNSREHTPELGTVGIAHVEARKLAWGSRRLRGRDTGGRSSDARWLT